MQSRLNRHQICQSVIHIPPQQVTIVRSISPVVIRTQEVPVYYESQIDWKKKYYDLKHQYWLLEDKCYKIEQQQIKQSRCEEVRESELKQINELFNQSQHDIHQLKSCLVNVDRQLKDDYQQKYYQVNHQLEIMKNDYEKLQQEYYSSQKQSIDETQRYPQQLQQMILQNNELQKLYEKSREEIKLLQSQIDILHIRYSNEGNLFNKIQELAMITVLKNVEIESLRSIIQEKDEIIQTMRQQYLSQYKS